MIVPLTVTRLKCIWNKSADCEKMKVTSTFGIFKAMCHNVNYLLSFGKRKL